MSAGRAAVKQALGKAVKQALGSRIGTFSPLSLFGNGEQGALYYPSLPSVPRRNLLVQTGTLSNAVYAPYHSALTLDPTVVAPDGTKTAWRLTKVGTDANPAGFSTMVSGPSVTKPRTFSIKAKAATHTYLELTLFDNDTEFGLPMLVARFNLLTGLWEAQGDGTDYVVDYNSDTGAVTYALAGTGVWSVSISALTDGWYLCTSTIKQNAGHTYEIDVVSYADSDPTVVEAAGGYALVCNPQFEDGVSATSYQAIVDYGTADQAAILTREAASQFALYQDAAGTTPVTAVEQPVGLMLDQRFGLARGTADYANGTYVTASSYANVTTVLSPTSFSTVAGGGGASRVSIDLPPTTVGQAFEVTARVATVSGGNNVVVYGRSGLGGTGATISNSQQGLSGALVRFIFAATGTATSILFVGSLSTGCDFSIDSISIKALPGNHASQSTAAARPVLSARKNQLVKSADLTDAVWVATSATKDSARQATLAAGFTSRVQQNGPTSPVGTTMTYSVKLSGTGKVQIYVTDEGGAFPSSTSAIITLTDTPTLYTVTRTQTDASATRMSVRVVNAQGSTPATVLIDEPQFEYSSTATRYQRVNTATDYDTVGFPLYLKFDGVDDYLLTPRSISLPASGHSIVVAGARMQSTWGPFIDVSNAANAAGTSESVSLGGGGGGSVLITHRVDTLGSFNQSGTLGLLNVVTDGRTHIESLTVDSASNLRVLRADQTQVTAQVAGSTTFLSPMGFSIGREYPSHGNSLLVGNIYGITYVNKQINAVQIASTERFLANLAGVTL